MDPFQLSLHRLMSSMNSIANKYNFPFEDDILVSIKSLTYDTHDGPKVWGEEQSIEILDTSSENNIQCQESMVQKQNSDFEEDYTHDQSLKESHFTNLHEESQFSPGNKTNAELASIKCHLANIHIKENTPLECNSGTIPKNECKIEMDMLLEDCVSSVPTALAITTTKPRSIHQLSPLQEMENKFLNGYDMVQRKQLSSIYLRSPKLFNSATSHSMQGTVEPKNQSLCANNETGRSSFLEMYESADEECSWNNVTVADLYPGMVETLSRLLHKVSYTPSSYSLSKQYKYKYWYYKKPKFNTNIEKARKSRVLKLKPSFMAQNDEEEHSSIGKNGHNSPFYKHQIQCSEKSTSRIESTVSKDSERMEIDCSGITEVDSYCKRTGKSVIEPTIFPRTLNTEKTFFIKNTTCFPLTSDSVKKNQSFAECIIHSIDSDITFNPVTDGKTRELSPMAHKTTSCLSLTLNNNTNSVLQRAKSSVKTSDGLQKNHDIKTSTATVSLLRSHSFSSFPVNQNLVSVHQNYEDAFENIYKELSSPKLQKPFKFSNIFRSPRKSAEVHISALNNLSYLHKQTNNMIEDLYQKLCPEGFTKIPTLLRAANLKKYEGMQISETVNALVNSPVRMLPAVARIKRAAHFCNEDSQSSPLKRLKNKSGHSYTVCQKLPCWESIKRDTNSVKNSWASNMTRPAQHMARGPHVALQRICGSPQKNRQAAPYVLAGWVKRCGGDGGGSPSCLAGGARSSPCLLSSSKDCQEPRENYGFSVSSDHSFAATSIADMKESKIVVMNENFPKCFQSCDFPRKSQNYVPKVSRKLSYNDGKIRSNELLQKDYEGPFLERDGKKNVF